MKMLRVIGGCAALLAIALTTSANSVPNKTRSAYGDDGSPQHGTQTTMSNGVSIETILFCGDASINSTAGTCAASVAFQITTPLPAGTTAFTLDLPIPTGTSLDNSLGTPVGFLTDDGAIASPTVPILPFSPFDATTSAGLGASLGTDIKGNPTFTLSLTTVPVPGGGNGLALYMDLLDNATIGTNGGLFCFTVGTSCSGSDLPSLPLPQISLTGSIVPAPEPASLMLLGSGLVGLLGLSRRRRA